MLQPKSVPKSEKSKTEKNDLLLINLRIDVISLLLFVLAAVTRFYKLEEPRNIV